MPDEGYERVIRNYPMMRISLQYCDPALKARLTAMYGLLASLEDCIIRASDPAISRAKLSWWYDELQQARTRPGNHPVTVSLQGSGALSCWTSNLIEKLLKLTLSRVDAPGLNDEEALRTLCEAIGMLQLELEASLYDGSSPDLAGTQRGATIDGFMQILRESFLAKLASFYWVPLTHTAHSGLARSQIASNRAGTESRQIMISMLNLLMTWGDADSINRGNLRKIPPVWAACCRHWLILTVLQLRQLQRLKRNLEAAEFSGDITSELLTVKLGDGWTAWRTARQLSNVLKEVRA